ncbi:MAG: TOBE domain-containing protein, partial [Fimbriimonadaceae bacterium]
YVTHDQVEAMTMGQRIAVMSDGLLQQCDQPENVYNQPANKFVAGFIGAPPMNFIGGTVHNGTVDLGAFKIELPQGHPARGEAGKSVTIGIRPEDIYDCQNNCPVPQTEGNTFEAKVDVLEKLGAEDTAYLVAGEIPVTATLDPSTRIHPGTSAKFAVDLDKVHVFDDATGAAIR